MTKYAGRDLVFKQGSNTVGQVTSLGPAGSSRDLIDASAFGDAFKDYVVGQQDGSEIEVGIAYDPADTNHAALLTAAGTGGSNTFSFVHSPSSMNISFPARITKLERGGDRDGLLVMNVTLKIVGTLTG